MMKRLNSRHLLLKMSPGFIEARLLESRLSGRPPRLLDQQRGAASDTDPEQALRSLCLALPQQARSAHVVLSDAFCRYFALPRPHGTARRSELEAAQAQRLQDLFGEDPARWILRSTARPWDRQDFVCAIPRALHDALIPALASLRLKLLSLRPYWICCCEDAPRQRSRGRHWLLAADDAALTLGVVDGGRCRAARSQPRTDFALQTLLARERPLFAPSAAPGEETLWLYGQADITDTPADLKIVRVKMPSSFGQERRT